MSEFEFLHKTPGDSPTSKPLGNGIYKFALRSYAFFKEGEDQKEVVRVNLKPISIVSGATTPEEFPFAQNVRMKFWYTERALALADRPTISMKAFLKHILKDVMTEEDFNASPFVKLWESAVGKELTAEVRNELEGKQKNIPVVNVVRILNNA